jgi:hypothetical protein
MYQVGPERPADPSKCSIAPSKCSPEPQQTARELPAGLPNPKLHAVTFKMQQNTQVQCVCICRRFQLQLWIPTDSNTIKRFTRPVTACPSQHHRCICGGKSATETSSLVLIIRQFYWMSRTECPITIPSLSHTEHDEHEPPGCNETETLEVKGVNDNYL